MREYLSLHRFRVSIDDAECILSMCESTADPVWLSRHVICDRYTLRGVPGRLVDLIADRTLLSPHDERDCVVMEIGRKTGRYDGAERLRICLRWQQGHQCRGIPEVVVGFTGDPGEYVGLQAITGDDVLWGESWACLRSDLAGYDLPRVLTWHWARYYRHLDCGDVDAVATAWAEEFRGEHPEATLAEANRSASRALYRLSRDLGWRKTTLRERTRLGIDGPGQWYRAEWCEARKLERSATGCGQYTLDAAQGREMRELVCAE